MSSPRSFVSQLGLLAAFIAPVGYLAYITAVIVHEVIGHGLTALAVGGEFDGFVIYPDGMGYATARSEEHEITILFGGVSATILCGGLLLAISRMTARPLVRLALLLFATCLLEEGFPYGFWNSLYPRPPGDLGRIIILLNNDALRWFMVLGFGLGWLVSIALTSFMLFRCLESILGALNRERAALLAWGFIGLGGAAAWFAFDWNQIIEDIGSLPQIVGAGLQLVVAPFLVALRRQEVVTLQPSARSWAIHLAIAWTSGVVFLLVLLLWLREGVTW